MSQSNAGHVFNASLRHLVFVLKRCLQVSLVCTTYNRNLCFRLFRWAWDLPGIASNQRLQMGVLDLAELLNSELGTGDRTDSMILEGNVVFQTHKLISQVCQRCAPNYFWLLLGVYFTWHQKTWSRRFCCRSHRCHDIQWDHAHRSEGGRCAVSVAPASQGPGYLVQALLLITVSEKLNRTTSYRIYTVVHYYSNIQVKYQAQIIVNQSL